MESLWQAAGPAKYWDANGAEWDISAMPKHPLRLPLTGPGAVDRKDHGHAQEEDDGEVEVVVGYIGRSAGLTLDECSRLYHSQRHPSFHHVISGILSATTPAPACT